MTIDLRSLFSREHVRAAFEYFLYPFGRSSYRCRVCDRLLWLEHSYCGFCFLRFLEDRAGGMLVRRHPLMKNFQVRGLWSWIPELDDELSGVLVGLKGGGPTAIYRDLARAFLAQHARGIIHEVSIAGFIPMPSKNGKADHASCFAEALAAELGVPVFYALERLSGPSHRRQNRAARLRSRSQIQLKQDLPTPSSEVASNGAEPHRSWVLVDDILTTGATSRAAMKALGLKATELNLWVLAFRERKSES